MCFWREELKKKEKEESVRSITVVNVPKKGWSWGVRCEIRVHPQSYSPNGYGYGSRCIYISENNYDHRFTGKWSRLGREIFRLQRVYNVPDERVSL